MAPSLHQAIARGHTLLTPTQRAARAIRHAHDSAQQAAGRKLWQPANVLPLESWLAAQWHERLLSGTEIRILLNRTQEHALWREIIQADPETPSLRSADSLADLAARAWSLLNLYNGRRRLREFSFSTDSKAFDRWTLAFERRLQRAQLISPSELPSALATRPQPASLALVDFDTLPPALAQLFDLLKAERLQTATSETEILQHAAEDDSSELQSAAHWIRDRLGQNPEGKIAVVVPNLAGRRADIDRAFAPILAPQSLPITAPAAAPVYEFSLGRPLADLPLVLTALDLLAWLLEPLPIERIGGLLLSPFLQPSALSAAAGFDAHELRQLSILRPELTLERTLELLWKSSRREALAPLRDHLYRLHRAARDLRFSAVDQRQPYAAWADAIATLLDEAGWTNQASRASLTFQQHRRFESALDELATLDAVAPAGERARPTAAEALGALNRLLRQTIFAPESQNAPVQILGPLELGGIPFDALWFLSADDLTWPPPTATNPLIPWQLQRALGLPGADRVRDDAAAQALTSRIARSAATAVFSYAGHSSDGDRRPSPHLAALKAVPLTVAGEIPNLAPLPLESFPENASLPQLTGTPIRGGSAILKLQAACAFRAFAEKRLASTALDNRDPGLNALERGSIVHSVMQHLWTSLQSRANLLSLTPAAVETLLDAAIDQAFAKTRPSTPWDEAFLAVQRQSLKARINPWLALERARPDFTVLPTEQERHIQLGPLALTLRIDRIDQTAQGLLILDYKTSLAAPKSWRTDRPDEPQLPLYAVLSRQSGESVAGLAFAILRPGVELALEGYAEDPALLLKAKSPRMETDSLDEQIALWHDRLTALAEAFAAGDTRVDPKSYPATCEHCGQRILCRLNPETLAHLSEDDLQGEGEPADG